MPRGPPAPPEICQRETSSAPSRNNLSPFGKRSAPLKIFSAALRPQGPPVPPEKGTSSAPSPKGNIFSPFDKHLQPHPPNRIHFQPRRKKMSAPLGNILRLLGNNLRPCSTYNPPKGNIFIPVETTFSVALENILSTILRQHLPLPSSVSTGLTKSVMSFDSTQIAKSQLIQRDLSTFNEPLRSRLIKMMRRIRVGQS